MPACWPDRNHTRYFLVRVRVISDRVSLAASHHSITSELSPVLLLRSPAAVNWKQIVMKALFTAHLLHFSQLCPHFSPWFNSNGITCSEMFGKASHSLPGVSWSHSSSLWQLSDMHCRAHRYKAYIHLARIVAGKRLEAAQIPADATAHAASSHFMGMKGRDSPSPNGARRQWSREAHPKLSSISYTKKDTGVFPSPAKPQGPEGPLWPRQHPPAPMAVVYFCSDAPDEQPHGGSAHSHSRGYVSPTQVPQASHSWLRGISVDSNGLNTTNVLNLDSDRSKPVNNKPFAYHQSDSLNITSVLAISCIFLDAGYVVFCISKELSKFWKILEY